MREYVIIVETRKIGGNKLKSNDLKKLICGGIVLAAVCVGGLFLIQGQSSHENGGGNTGSLLEQIESYSGYTRSVSQEEYDFYKYFVERENYGIEDEQELDRLVREYINEVNAVFYLGNKLNLCEPYSFSLMELRMEQENRNRELKKENDEVIYGLEQFTLETYYQYTRENLENDIYACLEQDLDRDQMKLAEDYYNNNKESFESIESITYDLITEEGTETLTADKETLDFMGNSDMGLADFLITGEVGDVYTDTFSQSERKAEIKEIVYSENTFAANKEAAVYLYVREELYPSCIEGVAQRNPVEFVLNQD